MCMAGLGEPFLPVPADLTDGRGPIRALRPRVYGSDAVRRSRASEAV